jgi:hypothetical protein
MTPRPLSDVSPPNAVQLPFRVRIVRTEDLLTKAVQVRAESYRRHHPEVAELLTNPEDADRTASALVLLAESKTDGTALGTLRIETNIKAPLPIESLMPPDSPYSARTLAFVTRLGIRACSEAALVKLALFKALYRYCLACQIDWIVVTARPPMDRQYLRLGFMDVYDANTLVPISWSEGIKMRLLALETMTCEQRWREQQHPFYSFMVTDYTPDIGIFDSVSGIWGRPRSRPAPTPSDIYPDAIPNMPLT